jgi:hypothetical protein
MCRRAASAYHQRAASPPATRVVCCNSAANYYERDAQGKILSVYTGGMQAWPITDYRARERVV